MLHRKYIGLPLGEPMMFGLLVDETGFSVRRAAELSAGSFMLKWWLFNPAVTDCHIRSAAKVRLWIRIWLTWPPETRCSPNAECRMVG